MPNGCYTNNNHFIQPAEGSTNSTHLPVSSNTRNHMLVQPNRARAVMTSSSQCIRNCRNYGAVRFLLLYIIFINLNQCAACAHGLNGPSGARARARSRQHITTTHTRMRARDLLMEKNVCARSAMCRVHQFVTLYTREAAIFGECAATV